MGGVRSDFILTNRQKLFYRFMHDDNIAVTGFGGVGLSAFANSNSTNLHAVGWDYSTTHFVHSIRFSFLKFINGIVDGNALAGTPVQPAAVNLLGLGGFIYGPNANAPQATIQQNRQVKYDGSFVHGHHTLQYGTEFNRIDQGGFANFFGLGPRMRSNYAQGIAAVPFSTDGINDPLNYQLNSIYIGNGLGALSEKPDAFGEPHGGLNNNRFGVYVHDTWKATNSFTLNGGLRYDLDTGLTNSDLMRAPLINAFDPQLGGKVKADKLRLAPQAGFAWNLDGAGKTVIRGGGGLYYDTNIFNNLSFDRQINLPPGFGNAYNLVNSSSPLISPIDGSVLFDFATQCTGAQPGTSTPNSCWGAAVGTAIPFALQAQDLFQQASAQLSNGWPQPGTPPLINTQLGVGGGAILNPHYKSPYGAQINIGVQRQIRPGLVLNVDYVMNRGVHFYETQDRNRIGAANTLDVNAAQAAMNAAFGDMGCNLGSNSANVDCVIAGGADISEFSGFGLGKGSALDGFAFSGMNKSFRTMDTIEYAGVSRYQALQVLLSGRVGTWGPFRNVSTNVTYALSRFNSSSTDQDFLFAAIDNDNLTGFYGPSNLDRLHQLGVSFIADLPVHFRISTTTQYRSNEASIGVFASPASDDATEIFISDFNGDGTTTGDPIPGTNRGDYGRKIHNGRELNKVLDRYNSQYGGTLTPAGEALVNAGLFTQDQLVALNATTPLVNAQCDPAENPAAPVNCIQLAPTGQINNPNFYTTDIRLSWRYTFADRLIIEPMVDIFNVLNRMNGVGTGSDGRGGNTALDGTLSSAGGSINGTTSIPERVGSGSGSFSSGTPRSFQFGIRVSF